MALADLERRFGALRRLYGAAAYERLRALRVAVVGLGGVGSWAAEALARSGVAELVLIDFDHVAESNINRQVQATGSTLGQAKGEALRERIADIHPGCEVRLVDEFVTPQNWPALLPRPVDALIDACDQPSAKAALAAWALHGATPFVMAGAAGGKRRAQAVEVEDLWAVTHDPLLSSIRQRLRKHHGAARQGPIGVRCVFSREPVQRQPASGPVAAEATNTPGAEFGVIEGACVVEGRPVIEKAAEGGLHCAGYGSSVTVTATFGLVAASEIIEHAVIGRQAVSQGTTDRQARKDSLL